MLLEWPRKPANILSQNISAPRRDVNLGHAEYEAGVPTTLVLRSLYDIA
jgi:hypothetical protein